MMCPFALAQAWAPISTAFCRVAGRAPLFTSYTLKVLRGNKTSATRGPHRELGYRPRELGRASATPASGSRKRGFCRKLDFPRRRTHFLMCANTCTAEVCGMQVIQDEAVLEKIHSFVMEKSSNGGEDARLSVPSRSGKA